MGRIKTLLCSASLQPAEHDKLLLTGLGETIEIGTTYKLGLFWIISQYKWGPPHMAQVAGAPEAWRAWQTFMDPNGHGPWWWRVV